MINTIAETFDGKPVPATFPLQVWDYDIVSEKVWITDAKGIDVGAVGDRDTAESIVAILNAAYELIHGDNADPIAASHALPLAAMRVAGVDRIGPSEIDANGRDCDGSPVPTIEKL